MVKNNGTHGKVLSQGILKYQSSSNHCSKIISKVKVFKEWIKLQGQGHRVKNNGTHGKVLSQGILMWNIKALAFTVQKLLARLKFRREWQNDGMTEWQKTICPPIFDLGGIKNSVQNKNKMECFYGLNLLLWFGAIHRNRYSDSIWGTPSWSCK